MVIRGVPGHDGRIAMIQEKNKPSPKLWKLVGGTRENGEDIKTAAHREVLEEIGIVLQPVSEEDIIYEANLNGKYSSYDFVLLEGRYRSGEIRLGDEVEKIEFFTPAQVKEMIKNRQIVKNHADALQACL